MSKQNDKFLDNVETNALTNDTEGDGLNLTSKKFEEKASTRVEVKISAKHIDYLVNNLDFERFEAIRLLKRMNNDLDKCIEEHVLADA